MDVREFLRSPNNFAEIAGGDQDFAERWGSILDIFDAEGVRFGLEPVSPRRRRPRA